MHYNHYMKLTVMRVPAKNKKINDLVGDN